jgi:hypothetical protein
MPAPSTTPWPLAALAGLSGLILGLGPAAAAASLETASGKPILQEARFVYDVEFLGSAALVESTQIIANPSKDEQEAVYTFDLPLDAAVIGLQVRLSDGRSTSMTVVDSSSVLTLAPDPDGVDAAADVGLLRLVARDVPQVNTPSPFALATYELRVYPVLPGSVVTLTTKWVAPLRYDDGRLSLRIPPRGDASNLVRERVDLSLSPPSGVRGFSVVHGGGKLLGKAIKRASFTAPPRIDIAIDAMLELSGSAPLVAFAPVPIRDGFGALGVSIMAPLPSSKESLSYERVVILADVSRSVDAEGLVATAKIADALLASLPGNARAEVILFDRQARRVFGSFTRNSADARKQVAQALRPGLLHNGSDLGAALELARAALSKEPLAVRPDEGMERGGRAPTLMAIISDGLFPLELDGRGAVDRIGDDMLGEVEVFAITLVPDHAAVPDLNDSALARLASRSSGRAIAMRVGEVSARARNLAVELSRPAPLRGLALDTGSTIVEGIELPITLEAGQGVTALGFYHGSEPKKLAVTATRHEATLRFEGKRDLGWNRAALPLVVASAAPEDFIPRTLRVDSDPGAVYDVPTLEQARRLMVQTARRASAVTQQSAMVALDARDRFAKDRLALTSKWGPAAFFRLPPPPEREPGYQLRAYEQRVDAPSHAGKGDGTRRTGELDRGIIQRLLTTHVVPGARACYEKALRSDQNLGGSMVVVVEIARGEVQHARVEKSTFPGAGIEACVAEAAYSMQIPRVALGDDPETIGVVRYPLSFKKQGARGQVHSGDAPGVDPDLVNTPLGGMKSR